MKPSQYHGIRLLEGEAFKPIAGYESAYEVSNFGRVLSLPRLVFSTRGKGQRSVPARILTHYPHPKHRYPLVTLSQEGKRATAKVHQLVAVAFHGPRPSPKHQVHHKDHNRSNAHAENLQWLSKAEHDEVHGGPGRPGISRNKGMDNPNRELIEEQVRHIRHAALCGETHLSIATRLGVSRPHVTDIVNYKKWADLV